MSGEYYAHPRFLLTATDHGLMVFAGGLISRHRLFVSALAGYLKDFTHETPIFERTLRRDYGWYDQGTPGSYSRILTPVPDLILPMGGAIAESKCS